MKRLEELDSMRGIAAIMVMLSHLLLILYNDIPGIIKKTPLYFFISGTEAVIFFFILSGFVMSLPFFNNKIQYSAFFIKRVFRIYVPYIVAIIFTFVLSGLFFSTDIISLSSWFNNKWSTLPIINVIIEHFLLIGNYPTTYYNPVIWSLIQEMRISIIFPLIVFLVQKCSPKICFLVILICSSITQITYTLNIFPSKGYDNGMFETFHYTSMFIIGTLLAKYRYEIIGYVQNKNTLSKFILFIVAFIAYTYSRIFSIVESYLGLNHIELNHTVNNYGHAVGICLFIILVLSSQKLKKILSHKWLVYNGQISYSVYLFHMPVYLVTFHTLYGKIDTIYVISICIIATYILSSLSYHYVEKPSISLGKRIANRYISHKKSIISKEA